MLDMISNAKLHQTCRQIIMGGEPRRCAARADSVSEIFAEDELSSADVTCYNKHYRLIAFKYYFTKLLFSPY